VFGFVRGFKIHGIFLRFTGTPEVRSWNRRWLPPGLRNYLNRVFGFAIIYRGVYGTWSEAVAIAKGYDDAALLERVKQSALKVRQGEAAWEQDGVTFPGITYPFPLLACLERVGLANGGRLSVLDFGGSLGSTYFRCRAFLSDQKELRWSVVEQPHFVDCGRELFADEVLSFHTSLDECLRQESPNVVLLSAVLQYLERPYELLGRLIELPVEYLIIARTAWSFTEELLTVQIIPPSLYEASYPSWLFDGAKFMAFLEPHYELLAEFEGDDPPIYGDGKVGATFPGLFLRRKRA
jgi:putative methyltransferase (TIGR04325 family)